MCSYNESRSVMALLITLGFVASGVQAQELSFDTGRNLLAQADTSGNSPVQRTESTGRPESVGKDSGTKDSSKESDKKTAPAKKAGAEPETIVSPLGDYSLQTSTGFFDNPGSGIGFAQASSIAGYELAGSGMAMGASGGTQVMMTTPGKGRPIGIGDGFYVYPAAMVGLGFNDNVIGTRENRISSSLYMLSPEVVGEAKYRGDRYTVSYSGNYGNYANSTVDNYRNHEFWAGADNYFTTRFRTGIGAGYLKRYDPRGSTSVSTGLSEPLRWHAPVIRALGVYGAKGAMGRVEFEASLMQKRYENLRAVSESQDVDTQTLSGRFHYRVMPATYALVELRQVQNDYVSSLSRNDNTERRLYVGATWEATAKTEGSVKIGRMKKDFKDGALEDPSGTTWEANLRWSPLTYSNFDLETGKSIFDPSGLGNYIIGKNYGLTWNHSWASYINSRVFFSNAKAEFVNGNRADDTDTMGVAFFREIGRNFRVGVDVRNTKRTSTQTDFTFKRNTYMLTLEGVL